MGAVGLMFAKTVGNGQKTAYRSFRVFFRGFLWHIPNCIMLYINTLKHVAISR